MNLWSEDVSSDVQLARPSRLLGVCWGLAAIWFVAFVWVRLSAAGAGANITDGLRLLELLAIIVLTIVHATAGIGWRGAMAFLAIAVTISFLSEASSIATGFPFGFYVHNAPGPKPLGVPLHVPLAWFFLSWLAWTQACLLTRRHSGDSGRIGRSVTPVIGALIMTGYDIAIDPIGATVSNSWTYRSPSGMFGVPLSNFLGWIFTGWAMLQVFAMIEDRFPPRKAVARNRAYWLLPCIVWAASALQFPVEFLLAPSGNVIVGGRSFVIADIYEASVVSALLTMVFAAILAASHIQAFTKDAGTQS